MPQPSLSQVSIASKAGRPQARAGGRNWSQRTSPWLSHYAETIRLAIPLVVGQLALIGIWTADIMMAGWVSVTALAAATQASRMYQPFYFMALGITMAVVPLTAQAVGAGDGRRGRQVMRMGLWLAFISGLIAFAIMWFGKPILLLLQQTPEIADYAQGYLRMLGLGMPSTFAYMALRNYVSAHKMPTPPVVITCIGLGLNVGLNWLAIYLWDGAVALAAIGLASSISFTIMLVLLSVYIVLHGELGRARPFARMWRYQAEVMRKLLWVGAPIGITVVSETGMFIAGGLYTGVFGTVAVAASGISNQIAAVSFMVPLAISHATTIRVGHAAGAKQAADAMRAAQSSVIIVLGVTFVLGILIAFMRYPLIGLFINPADLQAGAVIAVTIPMLWVVAGFQISDGLQAVFIAVSRGINDTRIPALIAVASYWGVGAIGGIILATPLGLGPIGIWLGIGAGLTLASGVLGYRCWRIGVRVRQRGRIDL